jgi:pyruvate/2-oxoglutarate dehydrogenase complex dihydrolipoamide dehydrogenase (E3) component
MNALGVDNIFAAGDCCEFRNLITKKPLYHSLATTASKSARIAGENAAGGNAQFKGSLRAIGLRVFDFEVAQVGLSIKEAQDAQFQVESSLVTAKSKAGMVPGVTDILFETNYDKKTGKLLGACVVGKEGAIHRANIFAAAIKHGCTMHDIADLDLIYSPHYSPLWDGIILSGKSGKNSSTKSL